MKIAPDPGCTNIRIGPVDDSGRCTMKRAVLADAGLIGASLPFHDNQLLS